MCIQFNKGKEGLLALPISPNQQNVHIWVSWLFFPNSWNYSAAAISQRSACVEITLLEKEYTFIEKFIVKFMGKYGNNGNLGIIIISINFSIVCSQDMFWYWERDGCKAKVFEYNNTRASSNPLEMGLCIVRVLRFALASEARSNWWKVSQYYPDVLRRVLLCLLKCKSNKI